MDEPTQRQLPDCGLFRTGIALKGHEDRVGAGRLVYFHNHSQQGPPLVLIPRTNTDNRWDFGTRGFLVQTQEFIDRLIPLKCEGYYVVSENLHLSQSQILPTETLVQLGYNPKGEPIVFVASFEGNSIYFPSEGYRFGDRVFNHLEPAGFRPPKTTKKRVLH